MNFRGRFLTLASALSLAVPAAAHASGPLPPGTPSDVYASGTGDVWATFVGKQAEYTSYSYFFGSMYPTDLSDPLGALGISLGHSGAGATFLFNNNTAVPGAQVNLGSYASLTRLVFGIYVDEIDKWFYTGTGADNPVDARIHAMLTEPSPSGADLRLGLEDLCRYDNSCVDEGFWADWDYNDHVIDLENATANPEPVSMALLGTGLFGLAGIRRRRRKHQDAVL